MDRIEELRAGLEERGFNFSRDYEVINELGMTLFERAKMERDNPEAREHYLQEAVRRFEQHGAGGIIGGDQGVVAILPGVVFGK